MTGRVSLLWVKGEKGIEPNMSEGETFEAIAQEDYYRVAAQAKKEAVVEPYLDKYTNKTMATAWPPSCRLGAITSSIRSRICRPRRINCCANSPIS